MIDRKRNRMFVRPRKGLRVRLYHDPAAGRLDPAGGWVPRTVEWLKALRAGDVELAEPKKTATKKKRS